MRKLYVSIGVIILIFGGIMSYFFIDNNAILAYQYDANKHNFFVVIEERNVLLRTESLDRIRIDATEYKKLGDEVFMQKDLPRIGAEKKSGMLMSGDVLYAQEEGDRYPILMRYAKSSDKLLEDSIKGLFKLDEKCSISLSQQNWYQVSGDCQGFPSDIDNAGAVYYAKIFYDATFPHYFFLKMPDISGAVNLRSGLTVEILDR